MDSKTFEWTNRYKEVGGMKEVKCRNPHDSKGVLIGRNPHDSKGVLDKFR